MRVQIKGLNFYHLEKEEKGIQTAKKYFIRDEKVDRKLRWKKNQMECLYFYYKPNGYLPSPGTKVFQSQNISLRELQGFREKSKLKRVSLTYMCVCVYNLYNIYTQ